jgi:pimeloyl-ACP methyl ester carboxylesterase
MLGAYGLPEHEFTTYMVGRRRGLERGTSLADMSDDYADMIRQEFGGPVDVIGISTGGSIAQYFGADHADLVRRLVIHSSAYTLGDAAKKAQLEVAHLAHLGRWREAWAVLLGFMLPRNPLNGVLVWVSSLLLSLSAPKDPSDLVVTVEAEDRHDFWSRLSEITPPALVVAGGRDPFYNEALFRETAAGIPNARLILYEEMGHPASGKQFRRDLLSFLKSDLPSASAT